MGLNYVNAFIPLHHCCQLLWKSSHSLSYNEDGTCFHPILQSVVYQLHPITSFCMYNTLRDFFFSQRKNGYPWQEAAVREGDGEHEELLHKAEKLYLRLQEPCAFSVRICRRQVVHQTVSDHVRTTGQCSHQ